MSDAEAKAPILWPPDDESGIHFPIWIHWERPWCWERMKAAEGDGRGWDS